MHRSWVTTSETLVALLAEGVDRNDQTWTRAMPIYVALLAEGVDRNLFGKIDIESQRESRPPRGGRG